MRIFSLAVMGLAVPALLAASAGATPAAAQGGGRRAANACVSPLPMPLTGGLGGRGFGGGRAFAGRSGGAPVDTAVDSVAPRRGGRAGRGARRAGCPPFFPDSLALSPAQAQQIVALRAAFRQANAPAFAQLTAITDSARAARSAGATPDQVRAIAAQARPITQSLRAGSQQVQSNVEALLTPGQLAWMQAFRPRRRQR